EKKGGFLSNDRQGGRSRISIQRAKHQEQANHGDVSFLLRCLRKMVIAAFESWERLALAWDSDDSQTEWNRVEEGWWRRREAGGRRGCGRYCRRTSSSNASTTLTTTGTNATCTVSTAWAAPSVPSVSTATAATTRFRSISSSACLLSIRRSSYHDVIRVSEIQKVLDLTGVQTYIINSARVVFLNERPQPRPRKGVTNNCEVCDRSLLDSFRFCSLGCKMAGTAADRKRKNKILHETMKIKSTTESDTDESYTSTSRGSEKSNVTQSFTPSTPSPSPTAASLSSAKRRKGIPHRAPFGSLTLEF
ncbi:hypothetical protein GW17_00039405, partial [Ensete ventricosum]